MERTVRATGRRGAGFTAVLLGAARPVRPGGAPGTAVPR
ncbi:hypothetical protein SGM_0089 [Streptomyces griseoaurantiacus M045]|uniref:Uncharacterized protein n=1 Tax=Streptomyces griseoaurantiacus M045 TaxID=996637 RepID=F3N9Q5_9ACTN|nr:hypothetical protein SGM_0089 [Streptomyces griseoaurantiacus M045]